MAVGFGNQVLFLDDNDHLLSTLAGDVLCYSLYYLVVDNQPISLGALQDIISSQGAHPAVRLSVLNPDESIDYFIPQEDIVLDSVSYHEKYVSGQRRDLTFKLINTAQSQISGSEKSHYKYLPNINGLWYGTKIKYEQGIKYQGKEYYFPKGIYIINNFDLQHTTSARDITYQCTDKFGLFEGPTGTLEDGYEIPVDTPIEQVVDDILNLSGTDGYINDSKICILDNKFVNFKTQATIRIDAGGSIGNILEQLATQMSAEYYYNSIGHLVFYPLQESMNDINKAVIWAYDESQMNGLTLQGKEDVINVVSVTGNNIDGKIYSAVVKNMNLQSPLNIYHIKERKMAPITDANIFSDDGAKELANYHLRKQTILHVQQQYEVPYNPLLAVNNIVEVENKELDLHRSKYIINGISYTSGSATMTIEVSNITSLPSIGGINYDGQ